MLVGACKRGVLLEKGLRLKKDDGLLAPEDLPEANPVSNLNFKMSTQRHLWQQFRKPERCRRRW